jgi:hypothetical protein
VDGGQPQKPTIFRYWPETDMPTALRNVRSQGQSGKHMLALSFSAFDRSVAKVEN